MSLIDMCPNSEISRSDHVIGIITKMKASAKEAGSVWPNFAQIIKSQKCNEAERIN